MRVVDGHTTKYFQLEPGSNSGIFRGGPAKALPIVLLLVKYLKVQVYTQV